MHRPRDAEVEDDAALEADERRREVVHVEARRVGGVVVLRVRAEEIGGVARHGERLRVPDRVEDHVERIAADVAERADAGGLLLDERAVRDAAAAPAARLDVIDFAQLAGTDDLLDHLHVLVHAGLEADGEQLAALFLGAHDGGGLVERDRHGLFQQHVQTVLQRVDRAGRVLRVVGADAHGVQLLRVDHGFMVRVAAHALHAVPVEELFRLARDEIGARHDLHVRHFFVALDMALGDPSRADDADPQLSAHVFRLFGLRFRCELAQYLVGHCSVPSFHFIPRSTTGEFSRSPSSSRENLLFYYSTAVSFCNQMTIFSEKSAPRFPGKRKSCAAARGKV